MLTYRLPLTTKSLTNSREHWAPKARRAKGHRNAARLLLPKEQIRPVLVVRIIRIAPRDLDSDNLTAALKSVRDGVADALFIDDRSPLVMWSYGQERGEDGVRIEVTRAPRSREEREEETVREIEDFLGAVR